MSPKEIFLFCRGRQVGHSSDRSLFCTWHQMRRFCKHGSNRDFKRRGGMLFTDVDGGYEAHSWTARDLYIQISQDWEPILSLSFAKAIIFAGSPGQPKIQLFRVGGFQHLCTLHDVHPLSVATRRVLAGRILSKKNFLSWSLQKLNAYATMYERPRMPFVVFLFFFSRFSKINVRLQCSTCSFKTCTSHIVNVKATQVTFRPTRVFLGSQSLLLQSKLAQIIVFVIWSSAYHF